MFRSNPKAASRPGAAFFIWCNRHFLAVRAHRPWTSWTPALAGHTTPDTPITAVSRSPDLMDVFFLADDGYVWSAAFDPTGGWKGFWHLHADLPVNPLAPVN